jgi:hypothetical protein
MPKAPTATPRVCRLISPVDIVSGGNCDVPEVNAQGSINSCSFRLRATRVHFDRFDDDPAGLARRADISKIK